MRQHALSLLQKAMPKAVWVKAPSYGLCPRGAECSRSSAWTRHASLIAPSRNSGPGRQAKHGQILEWATGIVWGSPNRLNMA